MLESLAAIAVLRWLLTAERFWLATGRLRKALERAPCRCLAKMAPCSI